MRLVKAAVMRSLDQEAGRRYGIPGIVLMENAGLSVVQYLLGRFWEHRPAGRKVLILAGPGNNGGDGLVVGRHLYNRGAGVEVLLTAAPDSYGGDAAVNLKIVSATGIAHWVFDADGFDRLAGALDRADLIVDALFGTGFRGMPEEPMATLIRMVNAVGKPVLAVDLPSGMEADTGVVAGACIRADLTVTLGLPKLGLYLDPGAGYAGEVVVGDISFPPGLAGGDALDAWRPPGAAAFYLIDIPLVAGFMPRRRPTDHKGSYGHVAVVGGTPGYTGAIALAGNAALRSGAGLVTAVVPASLYPVLAVKLTEAMTRPAPESSGGGFSADAYSALRDLLGRVTALAVGPGLGQDPETAIFLHNLLCGTELPTVIDADALNILARDQGLLKDPLLAEQRKRWVLTPHPGEMSRLLGTSIGEVQADRVGVAMKASQAWGTTVVLKGAHTVVADPGGPVLINPTGNPGLATGGTGDVLAGLIAGLLAQGLTPVQAAAAGVYVHGWAADRLAAARGMAGLIAGDLLEELPLVLKEISEWEASRCIDRYGRK
ncbi:MAG: NAD(P)H-hydrate dehydratase [Thermacetogeniaceae bacterium]